MSDAKLVNIARLMSTYNLEIEKLPDKLKCGQCKLVLKDAYQLPCCCKFCRVCIDDMITRGGEFCPGDSEDCGKSRLSRCVSDYGTNKKISRLTVKCPHDGCVHECQLDNIEQHWRECQRKSEECPFRELGCTQDKLAAEEMGGHLQDENRRHSEILIEMIANINREIDTLKQRDQASSREIETLKERVETSSREIETLKQRDEASNREIETLKQRDAANSREIETSSREIETLKERVETSSREIETLKQRDEASNREIETMKHELEQKDGQIRSIMDQMIHVQNEYKSIKNDIRSIKEEKEDFAGRVRILTEKIEREIAERHENDELDLARVIEHVDTEIAAVTRLIGSNKDQLSAEMQSVRGNIRSINQSFQSIKDDICSVKSQVQSVKALVGQVDSSFVWLIDVDIDKTYGNRESDHFTGEVHPYKYRLSSGNRDIGTPRAASWFYLRIYAGPNDGQFAWPFEARVVITVTDRDRREACRSISLQSRIERPQDNDYKLSDEFTFLHSELRGAGLNLSRGVRVSCVIVPGYW